MTGETIETRLPLPFGALLFGLAAVALDALALVTGVVHWAVLSALPWLTVGFSLLARPRRFVAHFTEKELQVEEPPQLVPYAELEGLLAPSRPANPYKVGPRHYPIQVIHSGGVLFIPAALNVPSDTVFGFIYQQFPVRLECGVPARLNDFLDRKERIFGRDRVWTCRARAHLGKGREFPATKAFIRALTASGIVWFVWGLSNRNTEAWVGAGFLSVLLGGLILLSLWLTARRPTGAVKQWRRSGLVLAPDSLALMQGDMTGQLRWQEIRDVKMGTGTGSFQIGHERPGRGIRIHVEGATIFIADVFNCPLYAIYQRICDLWRNDCAMRSG
jgi:hypothetical protein